MEKKKSFWEGCKNTVQALRTLDFALGKIESFLVFTFLAILILAEVAGSILREVYQSNLAWIEQLLKYVVIWIGMLGASLATQSKEHISIEIVSRFSGKRIQRILSVFLPCIAAIIVFFLARASWNYIQGDRRNYLIKAGQSGYLTLENISLYKCPEESNTKRESFALVSGQAMGYIEWLHEGIAFPQEKNPYPLVYLEKEIQGLLAYRRSLSRWNIDWLHAQWEKQWKEEASQAWNNQGKALWQEKGEKAILKEDRIEWQTRWMAEKWRKEGKSQCNDAWQQEGQKEWEQIKAESDMDEKEFQEEWEYQWTKKVWEDFWSKEMASAWKEEAGAQECFYKAWQKRWVQEQWQEKWSKSWKKIYNNHSAIYFQPGHCPYCSQKLIGEPWKIPRWFFLIILPLGLGIISFRFFLHSLEAIFLPETGEEALKS